MIQTNQNCQTLAGTQMNSEMLRWMVLDNPHIAAFEQIQRANLLSSNHAKQVIQELDTTAATVVHQALLNEIVGISRSQFGILQQKQILNQEWKKKVASSIALGSILNNNYHTSLNSIDTCLEQSATGSGLPARIQHRQSSAQTFPQKLYKLLLDMEKDGKQDIISFTHNGRAFQIHKPDKFFDEIVPHYFNQSRLSSFKRQLNLYGFEKLTSGPAKGSYYHEHFMRGQQERVIFIKRQDSSGGSSIVNGLTFKKSPRRAPVPDFYSMPPIKSETGSI